jgi:hypothetical protein
MGFRSNHHSYHLHICIKLEIYIYVYSSATDYITVLRIQTNKVITSIPDSKAPIRLSKTSSLRDRTIKRQHRAFICIKIISRLPIKDARLQPHNGRRLALHNPASPLLHVLAKVQLNPYPCNFRGLHMVGDISELLHFDE